MSKTFRVCVCVCVCVSDGDSFLEIVDREHLLGLLLLLLLLFRCSCTTVDGEVGGDRDVVTSLVVTSTRKTDRHLMTLEIVSCVCKLNWYEFVRTAKKKKGMSSVCPQARRRSY